MKTTAEKNAWRDDAERLASSMRQLINCNIDQEDWDEAEKVLSAHDKLIKGGDDGGGANMRLIAAAPDLAAEVIRLREALEMGTDLISGDTVGREWKLGCAAFLKQAHAALNHRETDNGTS